MAYEKEADKQIIILVKLTKHDFQIDQAVDQLPNSDVCKDYLQTVSASENTFKVALVRRLKESIYSGDLSHQEFIVVKKSSVNRVLKRLGLPIKFRKQASYKFLIKCLDFLSLKYGFAIEVDGSIHDRNPFKIAKDVLRDYIYKALDLHVFRISNDQVHNPKSLNRFISDIISFVESQERNPFLNKQHSKRKKKLSVARKAFLESASNLSTEERKYLEQINKYRRNNPKTQTYPALKDIKTSVQYGGYRMSFKGK